MSSGRLALRQLGSAYTSLGECSGMDSPEARLSLWLLHQGVAVCPLGLTYGGSGFAVRFHLNKHGNYEEDRSCTSSTHQCGDEALPHERWLQRVGAYPVIRRGPIAARQQGGLWQYAMVLFDHHTGIRRQRWVAGMNRFTQEERRSVLPRLRRQALDSEKEKLVALESGRRRDTALSVGMGFVAST